MDSSTHIRDIYKAIKSSKAKYGVYRKTLFHLHTPASYDFHLLSNWKVDDFRKCSEEKIVSECYKQGVLPKEFARENLIFEGELAKTYDSKKEWLSYLLVAGKLFQNKYEVVLISDHNSLKGFDKLQRAVEDYYNAFHKGNKDAVYPELINGVEVSCADKFHVVGIFDKESREAVEQWLNENVMSEELGKTITKTTFSFTIGKDAYIVLDFNNPDDMEIEKLLKETKGARHTFVITHGPLFPFDGGSCRWFFHGGNTKEHTAARRHFRKLFAQRNVVCLCGHVHSTEFADWHGDGGRITQMTMNR